MSRQDSNVLRTISGSRGADKMGTHCVGSSYPRHIKVRRSLCVREWMVPLPYPRFAEAMFWLEGKRALEMGGKIRELRTGKHAAH